MRADPQTIEDLELFAAAGGGEPLRARIDRCRTALGSRRLADRLAHPSSDPEILGAWFAALGFIHESELVFDIDGSRVAHLDRYLDAALASTGDRALRSGAIETLWIGLRDPGLVALAKEGAALLSALLAEVLPIAEALAEDPVPAALRVPARGIVELEAKLGLRSSQARATRLRGALDVDDHLRRRHRGDMKRFLSLVADLDVYFAASELLSEGWNLPEVLPGSGASGPAVHVEATGAWHPFLEAAESVSFRIDPSRHLHVVSGPNMAGKTTFLRTIALCTWLAHCGLPVPASGMRFRPLGALFVTLHPRDDLRNGVSLFLAEVLRVREILGAVASGQPTLAIFDELFRGTNPHDAAVATDRVIRGLSGLPQAAIVASTHLAELAESLSGVPGVKQSCFRGEVVGEVLRFDYRLRDGVSHQRLGLELLERHGLGALLDGLNQQDRSAGTAGS
jgi:DNA mismatch repair protein MutS